MQTMANSVDPDLTAEEQGSRLISTPTAQEQSDLDLYTVYPDLYSQTLSIIIVL